MTTAVILYNLGGPDRPEDVQPFLFNLFKDPMIIGAPAPIRWALAKVISKRRAPIAREIYAHIGGGSPLLANTRAQAEALEAVLNAGGGETFACHVAMRYWHPMCDAVMDAVIATKPDRIVLLPLYPQFSTTTVGSMMRVWEITARKRHLDIPVTALCCYPTHPGFVEAVAERLETALTAASTPSEGQRILFSAHGLPKQIVDGGDPYQWQVEQTARAVVDAMASEPALPDIADWQVCYQSRVGPLEWIGPSTEEELERAARDGVAVVVVPIAFVSEHSETLVELDIEYRAEAEKLGVLGYVRVPAVGTEPAFISGLADVAGGISARGGELTCGLGSGARVCPAAHGRCAMTAGG